MARMRRRRDTPSLDHVEDMIWESPVTSAMLLVLGALGGAGYVLARLLGL